MEVENTEILPVQIKPDSTYSKNIESLCKGIAIIQDIKWVTIEKKKAKVLCCEVWTFQGEEMKTLNISAADIIRYNADAFGDYVIQLKEDCDRIKASTTKTDSDETAKLAARVQQLEEEKESNLNYSKAILTSCRQILDQTKLYFNSTQEGTRHFQNKIQTLELSIESVENSIFYTQNHPPGV